MVKYLGEKFNFKIVLKHFNYFIIKAWVLYINFTRSAKITSMTTSIKAKLKKSDGQANMDKYI